MWFFLWVIRIVCLLALMALGYLMFVGVPKVDPNARSRGTVVSGTGAGTETTSSFIRRREPAGATTIK